jgi:hypothetical protein
MKGGFESSLFGAAVWVIASTGNISAAKLEVGYEWEPGAGKPAYAKIAAGAFCRSAKRAPGILS